VGPFCQTRVLPTRNRKKQTFVVLDPGDKT
jgi:hypothetical protein